MAIIRQLQRTSGARPPAQIATVSAAEERHSSRRPLGEELREAWAHKSPRANWLWCEPEGSAYAGLTPGDAPQQLELTAYPDQPEAAVALLAAICQELPSGLLWTHGDLAMGRQAATALQLRQERELWLMQRELTISDIPQLPAGIHLRPFDVDRDPDKLLELNSQVFAELPDQGSWELSDLQLRLATSWFDPNGLLLAEVDEDLVGFHWTKLETDQSGSLSGEVYVLGVAQPYRGSGLAAALLSAGLEHLRRHGARYVHLFVDHSNHTAVRLYQREGFAHMDTDRQFAW